MIAHMRVLLQSTGEILQARDDLHMTENPRHLAVRSKEHFSQNSAIFHHLRECDTCKSSFGLNSFRVLHSCRDEFELNFKEALSIKDKKLK